MWLSPSLILMLISIFSSILLVVSSPSFFISWIGLELNTLVFLPVMLVKKTSISSEAAIKYFLTQTLASVFIILSVLLMFQAQLVVGGFMMLVGLFIKLGAAPFHSWILSVAETLGWVSLFLLLTIQKINPLFMMWNFTSGCSEVSDAVIILSLVVGGFMGLTQTSARQLITFSSINHTGWLLGSLSFDLGLGVFYFFIYLIILLTVILTLNTFNISHINEFFLIKYGVSKQILLFLSVLSLGGLPPFLGFLPKWLVLQSVMGLGWYSMSLVMILGSLFTLFFYLRMTFSAFIMGGCHFLNSSQTYVLKKFNLVLLSLSILGLPLFLLY